MPPVRRVSRLVAVLVVLWPALAFAAPAAPGFKVKLLDSRATFDSREHAGKDVIVVRFQASWCRPCVRESAALSRLADRYRPRGVEVIALHVQDTAVDARRFVRTHHVSYRMALDPRLSVANLFEFAGTPDTIVIDRKGEIAARLTGVSAIARLPRVLDEVLASRR
jgi:peroxiredoxin